MFKRYYTSLEVRASQLQPGDKLALYSNHDGVEVKRVGFVGEIQSDYALKFHIYYVELKQLGGVKGIWLIDGGLLKVWRFVDDRRQGQRRSNNGRRTGLERRDYPRPS